METVLPRRSSLRSPSRREEREREGEEERS
jgi:hypothetical protein